MRTSTRAGRLRPASTIAAVAVLASSLTSWSEARAYEVVSRISPQIAANPIKVVYWVKPDVLPDDLTSTLAEIGQGLRLWEDVPRACISFTTARVVHSATPPLIAPDELRITIGNKKDITNGAASLPENGRPGEWFGVIADVRMASAPRVAAHEIGHAIGFQHSSIGTAYPAEHHPIMYRAITHTQLVLSPDDISAVAGAYPCDSAPYWAVTGTVNGILRVKNGTSQVWGVNVVAVEASTGRPVVARLSGELDQPGGSFFLAGLPPGTYRLEYRDGHSYAGSGGRVFVRHPPDGNLAQGLRAGYQADNFTTFSSAPFTVSAMQSRWLGEILIDIEEMSFDAITEPGGTVGVAYDLSMHIRGGLRDINASATGLPPGLALEITGNPPGSTPHVYGAHYVRIKGTPTQTGVYTVNVKLTDAAGKVKVIPQTVVIGEAAPVARYRLHGDGQDASGNGRHASIAGGTWVADRFGAAGRALLLGSNASITLPDEAAFDLDELTLVMVLNLPGSYPATGTDTLVSKGPADSAGAFQLARHGVLMGNTTYAHATPGDDWGMSAFLGALPFDRSFCLAVTLNGQTMHAYVDGQLRAEAPVTGPRAHNDQPVRIGGLGDGLTFMNGVVDEIAIYARKLSPSGVQAACQ